MQNLRFRSSGVCHLLSIVLLGLFTDAVLAAVNYAENPVTDGDCNFTIVTCFKIYP